MSRPTDIQHFKDTCVAGESSADPLECGALDDRCNDPAFAEAHPELCGTGNTLRIILKPATATVIPTGTIQYQTFAVTGLIETLLTAGVVYSSGTTAVATINSSTGLATGVAGGTTTITATWNGLTSTAVLTVTDDCGQVDVVIVIDRSKSMSEGAFGGAYAKRLDFAKAAASQFISTTSFDNCSVGVAQFSTSAASLGLTTDAPALLNYVSGIVPSGAFTDLGLGLSTAVSILNASSAAHKVILLISEGEEHVPDNPTDTDYLGIATAFKVSGGTIMCVGARATGAGFEALRAIATPGYFLNAYPAVVTDVLSAMGSLRTYFCSECRDSVAVGTGLIPTMTSNTEPSGVVAWQSEFCGGDPQMFYAFDNDEDTFFGVQEVDVDTYCDVTYTFPAPTTISGWSARWAFNIPEGAASSTGKRIILRGSNDGETWIEIDSQPYTVTDDTIQDETYTIPSVAYLAYAVVFRRNADAEFGIAIDLHRFQVYGASEVSCFESLPGAQLPDPSPLPNLEDLTSDPQSWTLTRSFTACCPPAQVGDCVTRIATYTSTISEADADIHATALARSAAYADLACCGGMPITIRDNNTASPYPSCLRVENHIGLIGTLKVRINGFTHTSPSDVGIVLVGPTGDSVCLVARAGCQNAGGEDPCPVSGLNFVFADGSPAMSCSQGAGALSSGTYAPTVCGVYGAFSSPAPFATAAEYGTALSVFAGSDPNGIWKLCVIDNIVLDAGTIVSWSLEIDDVVVGVCNADEVGDLTLQMADLATAEAALTFGDCDTAGGGVTAWDGTFIIIADGPDTFFYIATTQSPPLKWGGIYFNATVSLFPGSGCVWVLEFHCTSSTNVDLPTFWSGVKPGGPGTTAAGRYFLVSVNPVSGAVSSNIEPPYIDLEIV